MPEWNPIEFKNIFNPITKTYFTEALFSEYGDGEIYTISHTDESPILWIQDDSQSIGLSRSFLTALLPTLQRFIESGEIKPSDEKR